MGKGNDGISFPHLCQRPNGLGGQETTPSTPIYSGEAHGSRTPSPGVALSLPNTSSSSVVLVEALPENCKLHHHAIVLPEFFPNLSFPLAGSRRRIRPRVARVLNAEAPLFGA